MGVYDEIVEAKASIYLDQKWPLLHVCIVIS